MSFSADITHFAKKVDHTLDQAARDIKINLFSRIIDYTRVDTGRLKGNWQTSTGDPKDGEIERYEQPGTKSSGSTEAQHEVETTIRGDTVDYLTNNLPYAEVYEEKDGMVAVNMADINRIVNGVVNGKN